MQLPLKLVVESFYFQQLHQYVVPKLLQDIFQKIGVFILTIKYIQVSCGNFIVVNSQTWKYEIQR